MNSLQILLFSYSKINVLSANMENTHNGKKWKKTGKVGSAPACYGSSLGSNPDITQKYKIDDISKGVNNTHSSPPKKNYPSIKAK
jgi:hypothetical protein